MNFDRYGSDVLNGSGAHSHRKIKREVPVVPADRGLVVEDVQTGFVGAVLRAEKSGGMHVVALEDAKGRTRSFQLGGGFLIDGKPVKLGPPSAPKKADKEALLSASGSVYVQGARAKVALGSRIWVEGKHDAELVEKIWGHDLRIEGVVVELLEGADDLAAKVARFRPEPGRKLGILLDHLVQDSKESRLAEEVMQLPGARENVLILGHPYIDIWQAVKPARVGLKAWPDIPRGTDIKVGTLQYLDLPANSQADIADGWQQILSRVRTIADVDSALSGRVEALIDFVTAQ